MSNNWSKTVSRINRDRYQIPAGWDTKEQIAEGLQCAPERVADLLKPGITLGEIERQSFPVWDDGRRMAVQVVCYRVARANSANPAPVGPVLTAKVVTPKTPYSKRTAAKPCDDKTGRIRAAILRYPELSDYAVSRKLHHSSAPEVSAVRRSM